jgi:hypothetical protein
MERAVVWPRATRKKARFTAEDAELAELAELAE